MIEPGVNYADLFAKEVRKKPKKYPKTVRQQQIAGISGKKEKIFGLMQIARMK